MNHTRKLSPSFMHNLEQGFLSGILKIVQGDPDLDLQIRANYLNVYYKGNSLLKLSEIDPTRYKAECHAKFTNGMPIPDLMDDASVHNFINRIPSLKENIIKHGQSSLEIEYEQLIIRANNDEHRNNSEYFIIDRQYADPRGRFDLVGIFWKRQGRKKGDVVPLCLMEVKFALNQDIGKLHDQLTRYYDAMKQDYAGITAEFEGIFKQKLDLGLFNQPLDRINALKTSNDQPQYKVSPIHYLPGGLQPKQHSLQTR